jgi:DNA-directed RNA polymerase subunit K/omega
MKSKTLSRGPSIDMETCVENAGGNRFDLVLIATERAREIKRQNQESDKREHVYSIISALTDIQDGSVGKEYLKKLKFKDVYQKDHTARHLGR